MNSSPSIRRWHKKGAQRARSGRLWRKKRWSSSRRSSPPPHTPSLHPPTIPPLCFFKSRHQFSSVGLSNLKSDLQSSSPTSFASTASTPKLEKMKEANSLTEIFDDTLPYPRMYSQRIPPSPEYAVDDCGEASPTLLAKLPH